MYHEYSVGKNPSWNSLLNAIVVELASLYRGLRHTHYKRTTWPKFHLLLWSPQLSISHSLYQNEVSTLILHGRFLNSKLWLHLVWIPGLHWQLPSRPSYCKVLLSAPVNPKSVLLILSLTLVLHCRFVMPTFCQHRLVCNFQFEPHIYSFILLTDSVITSFQIILYLNFSVHSSIKTTLPSVSSCLW